MTTLSIIKGKTVSQVVRWETEPLVYKTITGITAAGPVAITAIGHGLVDGWRAAVISVNGMRQINAKNWPLRSSDFHKVTRISADVVTFNDVSSESFSAYTSGGSLVYWTPATLAGFTARMQIRDYVDAPGVPLADLTTENGGLVLDDTAKTITIFISATDTAAYPWLNGVFDLELVSPGGVVFQVLPLPGEIGIVTATDEVTR
jgi:hypothetical protein